MGTRAPFLNSRLQGLGATIFATMSQLAADTGSINLGQGFPDTDGPQEIKDAAIRAIEEGHNQYPPGPGILRLREAVARHQLDHWGIELDPGSEVLITAGATEAIAAAMLSLCEIGDEVIAFEPFYDAYLAAAAMAGARLVPVRLEAPNWEFDPDELRRAVSPRTRAILLNSPHNPTGKVFAPSELAIIAELCHEHDLIAITDEVYEHMVFAGGHVPLGTLDEMGHRTLTISSAAKTYSFTGWKIGWATGPAPLVAAVRTAKQFLTYVNGAPFQVAVAYALEEGRRFTDLVVPTIAEQRRMLADGLSKAGFDVMGGDGTYFLTTDISNVTDLDAMDFCLELPKTAGVVAVPSSVFYLGQGAGEKLVRWTFCKRREVIAEAVERLGRLA
ncbi:MAG: pyridoxal phosphate-dependent aminotransferase [Actinomycetota bacterium]|nr:pyridoxal phosphate-dependent aminotransferase [Actinomycetota bacterium]